jgi:hypothetical protein
VIETELVAKLGDVFGAAGGTEHDLGRIAGGDVDETEDDDGDAEDDGDHPEEAANEVVGHHRPPILQCGVRGV